MDVLGCRKTVIAGTFAIHRQIRSNSRPISGVERNARGWERKGYTRAMLTTSFTLLEQSAGAATRARRGGGPSDFANQPYGDRQGKIEVGRARWYSPHAVSARNTRTGFFSPLQTFRTSDMR